MATPNRTSLATKMYKVLKRHYKPVLSPERPVLETLLFAACLENSHYEPAEKAYATLSTGFFDWNEVRVTTIKELTEALPMLPRADQAAERIKKSLQSVFEATYSFELESLRKKNLGEAQQKLAKYEGVTPFAIATVTQQVLGGHSIPVDRALLDVFAIVGIVTEAEAKAGTIPGLEKAIAKNKGIEFASLAHQLAADLCANPYSPSLHKTLLEIAPDCKDRLPKRPPKGVKPPEPEQSKARPVRPDPPKGAPAKVEVGKKDSPKPDAGKPKHEAGKREPAKPEAHKKEPAKGDAARKEPARTEAPKKAPPKAEPPRKPLPAKPVKAVARPAHAAPPKKKPAPHGAPRRPR
jgi:endonuclease-3